MITSNPSYFNKKAMKGDCVRVYVESCDSISKFCYNYCPFFDEYYVEGNITNLGIKRNCIEFDKVRYNKVNNFNIIIHNDGRVERANSTKKNMFKFGIIDEFWMEGLVK